MNSAPSSIGIGAASDCRRPRRGKYPPADPVARLDNGDTLARRRQSTRGDQSCRAGAQNQDIVFFAVQDLLADCPSDIGVSKLKIASYAGFELHVGYARQRVGASAYMISARRDQECYLQMAEGEGR